MGAIAKKKSVEFLRVHLFVAALFAPPRHSLITFSSLRVGNTHFSPPISINSDTLLHAIFHCNEKTSCSQIRARHLRWKSHVSQQTIIIREIANVTNYKGIVPLEMIYALRVHDFFHGSRKSRLHNTW